MKGFDLVRPPAVAGLFYPETASALLEQIEQCFLHPLGPGTMPSSNTVSTPLLGLVCPHAGYVYSGPVAAHGYSRLAGHKPEVVVLVGPNHYGLGAEIAISGAQAWRTPLGQVSIERDLSYKIASMLPGASLDNLAHAREHSLEVQVPFLQYVLGDTFSLVAIALTKQDQATSSALGEVLATALSDRPAVVIASSDLNHYEPQAQTMQRDALVLEPILSLEPRRVETVVRRHSLTVCGPGAIAAMLESALRRGASKAELLQHATSGETSGDYHRVVGYASVAVS